MQTFIKVLIGLTILLITAGIFLGGSFISYYNQDAELRTAITAKLQDNQNEFDLMTKKIKQTAKVSDKQMTNLKDILLGYAEARTPEAKNQMMTWVQESVPNVDTYTYNNLKNIIAGSRDRFAMRQKELIDMKREHDLLLTKFPSGLFLQIMGKKKIDITVVTSSNTEKAFKTGKDDDIGLE